MAFTDEAKKLGVDVDNALQRFMGNADLLEKMIKKLPSSVYPSRFGGDKSEDLEVLSYMEKGDWETAVAKAHTLKGMMGNLSVTAFYQAYTKIVDLLRAGQNEEAMALTKKIQAPQEELLEKIQKLS